MRIKTSRSIAEKSRRRKEDFRLDFFRSGGNGGQNQNKVNSGVRITDTLTGLSVESREERSQLQNKRNAFQRLARKIIDHYSREESREHIDATDTIRTYKDGVVFDHRTKKRYDMGMVLDGDLSPIMRDAGRDKSSGG